VRQAHEKVQPKPREANNLVVLQYQNPSINESSGLGVEQMAEHLSTILHGKTILRKKLFWGESFGNAVRSLELTTSDRKNCTKRKMKRRKNI